VFGGWDPKEYEELKLEQPSYTDIYELLAIGPAADGEDLNAEVKRLSDGKVFDLGLSWLRPCDQESAAYTAMDDYATWQCSY
jgi:hypothetical protein